MRSRCHARQTRRIRPRVCPRLNAAATGGPLAADPRWTAVMQPMRLDTDSASAVHLHRLRQAPPPATDAANAPAAQPLQGRHEPAYHPQLSALSPTAAPQCRSEEHTSELQSSEILVC